MFLGRSAPDRRTPLRISVWPVTSHTRAAALGIGITPPERLDDPGQRPSRRVRPDKDPLAPDKHYLHPTHRGRSCMAAGRRELPRPAPAQCSLSC